MAPTSQYQDPSGAGQAYNYGSGWYPDPTAWNVYGGLWPFYNQTSSTAAAGAQNGQVVVGFCDSHVKPMTISQVAAGCSAYGEGGFKGNITDPSKFIWNLNQ